MVSTHRFSCFTKNGAKGLVQVPNTQRSLSLNNTTPPSGPPGTTSHLIFNKDGSELIASVKGVPSQGGFLATWDVDAKSGQLSSTFTKSVVASGGALPFGMVFIPGTNALVAADPGVGFDLFDFSKEKVATSKAFPIPGQKAACWTTFSSITGSFYIIVSQSLPNGWTVNARISHR